MGDNTGVPNEDLQLKNVFLELVLSHYSRILHTVLFESVFFSLVLLL